MVSSKQIAGMLLRLKYAVCGFSTDVYKVRSFLDAVCSTHCCEIKSKFNLKNLTTKMLNCIPHTTNIRNNKQLPTIFTKMLNCLLPTAKLLTAFCLLLTCQLTQAQLHPVQVSQNIVPPYNTKLNSYATTSAVKLRLYLTMNDANISNRQIRLKLKIQGQGLNIQSVNFVQGAPFIYLNGKSTQQFTNIDLAAYFQLHNLIGISPQQYNRPLPDGRYKICWEVYDFLSGQRISNPKMGGCSNIFLLLNDPPFLNIPNRGDQLTNIQPTNITFQWTPRHANASGVSYEFELRELWDTQIDPQAGFLAAPPYHSETTYSTTISYNISKPPLMPGRTYAWRVRAKSTTGLSENSVFKNNGYSEIFYFTYTDQCYPPTMTLAEPLNTGRVKISWKTHPDHNRYHLQYKRADVADAEWFEIFSYNNQAQVSNLQAGVTYDFRVGGTCHEITDLNQAFTYSNVNQFTMPTKDETVSYSCGIIPEIKITNTKPLANIGVNETFTAGDFPVTVKQKQGGNGTFSGTGYIVVPYLADTKIAVEFKGIKINTDYELYEGVVKTTYDPTWSSVKGTGDLFNGGDGQVNTSEVNFQIAEILVDPSNGDILLVGKGGAPIVELSGGEDYIITDSGDPKAKPPVLPKKYHVDEQGNVTELGPQAEGGTTTVENTTGVNSKGEATNITAQGVTVTFTQLPTATLPTGFDAYNSSQSQTKDLYKKLGAAYYMPYKAVAKGKVAFIVANFKITNDSIKPQDIIFKTKDGVGLKKVDSTSTSYTLKLKGTLSDADIETQALVKQGDKYQIAGAFMQYQIAIKEVAVVLVNTSNANTSAITKKLKAIYQQAAVSLNISVINDFTATLNSLTPDGTIKSGESGFAAQYTEQQRSINKALKEHGNFNPEAYYLILTDKQPSSAGEKGLMPLGRQFGYIFTANSPPSGAGGITVAHELAHGAFQLKHPFSTHSYKYATGSTNWLLDYNNGEHLPYVHWKAIHNPKLRIGVFDGDSEGESTTISGIPSKFKNSNGTYTFMTLNGSYITLPSKIENIRFVTSLDKINEFIKYPTGALIGFTLDSNKYKAKRVNNELSTDITITDFTFDYFGFESDTGEEFVLSEDNKRSFGKVIILILTDKSRRLSLNKVDNLTWGSQKETNILSNYNRFSKFYTGEVLEKNDYTFAKNIPFPELYNLEGKLIKEILGEIIDWNSLYLIASKIAVLNNAYPDAMDKVIPNYLSSVPSEIAYEALKTLKKDSLIQKYVQFVNGVKNETKDCAHLLSSIDGESKISDLHKCIAFLSNNEIEDISIDKKLIILSLMLDKWTLDNEKEKQLIRLIKFTKKTEVDGLLDGINSVSKVATADYNLLRKLVYKTDNDHTYFHEDNYKNLINVLADLNVNKSTFFLTELGSLKEDELIERNIKFYYKSFWNLTLGDLPVLWNFLNGKNLYSYDTRVKWLSEEDETISTISLYTDKFVGNDIVSTAIPLALHPYSPIYFTNKSGLSMLSEYNDDVPVISPAIVAFYASDVGNTQVVVDGVQATVDVASLASGYGALTKAPSLMRKTFIIADMLGSGVSLTTTAIGTENLSPQGKAFLDALNVLTATIAIGEISNVANLKKIFSKTKTLNKTLPSKNQAKLFLDKLKDAEGDIKTINTANPNKIKEAKIWVTHLEIEAGLGNVDDLVGDIAEAKRILGTTVKHSEAITALLNKMDDFPNLKTWVSNLDEVENIDIIKKIDEIGESYWSKLNMDFASKSNGDELKDLIVGAEDVEAWKLLKDDAAYAFELGEDGTGIWRKWAKANFFKVVTKKGNDFEKFVCLEKFKNRLSDKYLELKQKFSADFNKNLDEYDMFSQVQLSFGEVTLANGKKVDYFVADQVFVKYDAYGDIDDIIIIENKLSSGTRLTPNQKAAKGKGSYSVRASNPKKSKIDGSKNELKGGEILSFNGEIQWYKVHDGANGDIITGIKKI